jgi:hypothetical protein
MNKVSSGKGSTVRAPRSEARIGGEARGRLGTAGQKGGRTQLVAHRRDTFEASNPGTYHVQGRSDGDGSTVEIEHKPKPGFTTVQG